MTMSTVAGATSCQEDERNDRTSGCIKATLGIPEDVVLHHRDALDRLLEVLFSQWGLRAVELQVGVDAPRAVELTGEGTQHFITVAEYVFPLRLDYGSCLGHLECWAMRPPFAASERFGLASPSSCTAIQPREICGG